MGAAVLAVVLTLACGAAVATAATQPLLVGAVQNPSGPPFAGSLSAPFSVAAEPTSQGWFAYAPAYYNNDLTAINMSNPINPVITNAVPPSGNELYGSDTVNIFGGLAYVVSKNQNPACLTLPVTTGCSNDIVGNGNALSVFNVSADPTTPQFLGSISDATPGVNNALFGAYGVTGTTINGLNYALVAAQGCLMGQPCPPKTGGNDLAVINLATPSSPLYRGSVSDTPNGPGVQFPDDLDHPTAVVASGHYAYVTSYYGHALTVVDVSNPTSPRVVAEIQNITDFPAPADVAVQGNYAYVANDSGQGPFTVVDISNPTSPLVVGTVNAAGLNGGYRVRVSGDLAYVSARHANSITAMDITNPAAPVVLTSLSSSHLFNTTGLDLMNLAGSEYVVASSPFLLAESSTANPAYPPYPPPGGGSPTATGTISAIQLDPVADTAILAIHSEPSTGGQPFTTSTSANFSFATGDVVSAVACSLDGAPLGPCTSETTADYSNLALGAHTFSMQATDGAGNTSVASYAWTIETAPANTAPPTVTGSTLAGQTLTASTGSWTGSSLAYSYQWQRCDPQGAACAVLHTASWTYPLGIADVGHTVRVRVTASNGVGSQSAISARSREVKVCPSAGAMPAYCALPKVKVRPVITGTTEATETLVADQGSWSTLRASAYGGAQGPSFKVRWMRCNARGARCIAIAHATHKTYRVTRRDLGVRLRLQIVAQNRNGTTIAVSAPSAPIVKSGIKVKLVLSTPATQQPISKGFTTASIRSNVGALVDVTVGVRVGHGRISWTSGTPAEVLPGSPLRFKVAVSRAERRRLQRALASHQKLGALVTVSSPGHPRIQGPKPRPVVITG